jgi:2-iminobutanoate/2-iminopropanoate deaminase
MARQYINPAGLTAPPGGIYNHVVRVKDMVFISGQLARDVDGNPVGHGDIKAQYRQVWKNLCTAVEAAGGTEDDIVQTVTYVVGEENITAMREIRAEICPKHPPTSTMVVVAGLADSRYLVEVNAIAVLGD